MKLISESKVNVRVKKASEPMFWFNEDDCVYSLTDMKDEYEENKEDYAEFGDIHSFDEYLEMATGMGGSFSKLKEYFSVGGAVQYEFKSLEDAIDFAEDGQDIINVICPQ